MSVPSNLIPTRITQLPEYTGSSTLGYVPYVLSGVTYKVAVNTLLGTAYVPSTRTVTAGAGLTGGGALSSDITLSASFSASNPAAGNTTASPGSASTLARSDHVHPAVDLTSATQTQGVLPLSSGGTNGSLTAVAGAIVYSSGSAMAFSAAGTIGEVLTSNGAGTPTWAVPAASGVTSVAASGGTTGMTFSGSPITTSGTLTLAGTLVVANGGTGATTLTANNVLLGNGTSALQVVAPGTSGNILTSNGTTWASTAPAAFVYPSAGIANSTGTAWGTSYTTTGSGTVVALATTPTFTTNITAPLVIGGTAVSSTINIRSTSGVGTSDAILFSTGSQVERMRITTGGLVGIGTGSPTYLFDTENSSTAVDYIAGRFISAAAATGESRTWLKIEKANNYGGAIGGYLSQAVGSGLILGTQAGVATPVERMRITQAGDVGIGTTTPSGQLTVQGAGQATPSFNTAGALGGAAVLSDTGLAGNNGGALLFAAASGSWRFAAIKGLISNGASNSQGHLAFLVRPTATDATLTEAMRITSAGNVGIGTASPTNTLDVTGTLRVSGAVTFTTPPAGVSIYAANNFGGF